MTPYRKIRHGVREGGYRRFAAATPPSTLLDGLVSYWALDETSGTRVDAVGGNDLTDNNTVGYDTGVNGNAASFDRANNESLSIQVDDTVFQSLQTGSYAISGWFYPTGTLSGEWRPICIGQYYGSGGPFDIYLNYGYPIYTVWLSGGSNIDIGLDPVSANAWYHFYAEYNAISQKSGLSFNGVALTLSAGTGVPQQAPDGTYLTIGGRQAAGSFSGFIDEIGIWSRVLTSDERAELYNSGSGKFYPFT